MTLPKCFTSYIASVFENISICKCQNKTSQKSNEKRDSKDENRNERINITKENGEESKTRNNPCYKDANSEKAIGKNTNYNSIGNEYESTLEIELERRRRNSSNKDLDKFSVIKKANRQNRVDMVKFFYGRSLGRASITQKDVIREEEQEIEGEVEEMTNVVNEKKEEQEEEENIKEEGNEKGYQEEELKTTIMDGQEFRQRGKEMVDYIVDYLDNIATRRVCPDVKPGYLRPMLASSAPMDPEPWENIMEDVEKKIMPGVLHWNHPHFFAYFASGNSYPTILADMLADALAMMGFSWASGPVCTELEIIMLDWYGKAIGLPKHFISTTPGSKGGGVIQGSASECILVTMLAARHRALEHLRELAEEEEDSDQDEEIEESQLLHKLVVYCSREAHSCVEKAAKICLVKIRVLEPDEKGALRGETLQKAIEDDESRGLTPFFVSCIVGSTASCTFDNLVEIGAVCSRRHLLWMHVDCAYAGSAFVCPELRPLMAGIEQADSVNTNPNKWMLTCFDCSCLWVKDKLKLTKGMVVDPIYLKHDYEEDILDYRHWQIPLSRRFRSLKLFFLFRSYGIKGLQNYIRNHIKLAKYFETLVSKDTRFEVVNEVKMGLVCFRLKGPDLWTQELLAKINASGKIHMIPGTRKNKYFIRFAVTYEHAKDEHIRYAWKVTTHYADMVMEKMNVPPTTPKPRLSSRQHSFTRGVSRDVFKARSSSLYDGVSPIPVLDDDDDLNNNVFEEAFAKCV